MLKRIMLAMGVALVLAGGAAAGKNAVQVKGSDTMVHLSSAWAEKYMQKYPGVEISVTGGGSGTGISALINGTADLANSSREIKKSEQEMARAKGFEIREIITGMDGIAVIVNPSNPIKTLSMNQIKKIYTGEVNNWSAFGGPKAKIVVYTRDSSSGTFVFFQEHVLLKRDYSIRARRLASNSAIVQSVSDDVNSIGYVGLGYVTEAGDKIRALWVKKEEQSEAVVPSVETVQNKTYPISRPLYVYSHGEPAGEVKSFVDYILSSEGQTIVDELGFVSLK